MRPLYQPIVYTGDGVPITSDAYLYAMERYKVGDIVRHEVGAPRDRVRRVRNHAHG